MAYALNIGDKIPAFSATDQEGHTVTEKDLLGKTTVLYFYPKDCTPGCTKEACDFRDRMNEFSSHKTQVFGVSPDDADSHKDFIQRYNLNFPLITDENYLMSKLFDVWREKQFMGKRYMGIERTTFVIDPKGVIQWIERPVKVAGHGKRVAEAII